MRTKMFALIAILSVLLVSQNLFAQEMMVHKNNMDQCQMHQELNLTEEQQEKADVLKLAHQKEMIDLKANLEKKEVEMAELKNKGNYTREEFLNKISEISAARNKIALSLANHQMDIYQLLDDNQKKEWNKSSGCCGEKREKRMIKMMKDADIDVE